MRLQLCAPIGRLIMPDTASSKTPPSTALSDSDAHKYFLSIQSPEGSLKDAVIFAKTLRKRLENVEEEAHAGEEFIYFVPRCQQATIISFTAILEYIVLTNPSYDASKAIDIARWIENHSKSLFATLLYTKRGEDIYSLVEERICDKDLPFQRKPLSGDLKEFNLQRREGGFISTMQHWDQKDLRNFGKAQYKFIAPVFRPGQDKKYGDNIILPFIRRNDEVVVPPAYGGYSQVFQKAIHPSHHEFWDKSTCEVGSGSQDI